MHETKRKIRSALSREKILQRAVRLADQKGTDSLSMRSLAKALRVEAMSLYNHVESKDDLLDGMVELVVEKFSLPDASLPWNVAMRQSVISTHAVLLAHPWSASLLISRINTGSAMMRYSDACFGCLVEAGFSFPMADHAWNAIGNHLYGYTLCIVSAPVSSKDYAAAAEQYLPLVPSDEYPYVHGMMRVIISGEHSGVNDFSFGLDLILQGLEAKLAPI